jgi:5-methylcytosine-specific restriction protein A
MILAGVVVSSATVVVTSTVEISAMLVRPPIHRPVGRREKRERDRRYQRS